MAGGPYRLQIEPNAAETLEALPDEVKADFTVVLEVLRLHPRPGWRLPGIYWREVKSFIKLRQEGVPANIFKAFEVQQWRVFYFLDKAKDLVLVKEIVCRDPDPYQDEALAQRLRGNYRRIQEGLK